MSAKTTKQPKPKARKPKPKPKKPTRADHHAAQTAQLKKRALEKYAEACTISEACKLAGVGRRTFYDWLSDDKEFASEVERVEAEVADKLEAEAIRRAVHGVREPVGFFQGRASAYVRRYSDTLLIFLLKGHKPEKFKERTEHGGEVALSLSAETIDRVYDAARVKRLAERSPHGRGR